MLPYFAESAVKPQSIYPGLNNPFRKGMTPMFDFPKMVWGQLSLITVTWTFLGRTLALHCKSWSVSYSTYLQLVVWPYWKLSFVCRGDDLPDRPSPSGELLCQQPPSSVRRHGRLPRPHEVTPAAPLATSRPAPCYLAVRPKLRQVTPFSH